MIYAPFDLTGRRPDLPGVAVYLDRQGVDVDTDKPFEARVGRRHQSGSLIRLGVVFIPTAADVEVAFAIRFGGVEGRLRYEGGLWSVLTDDAEGGKVPVSNSPLLAGVSYAVSLCIDFGSALYRDVIVEGQRISPQVVDEVVGELPPEEELVCDILSDGSTVALPEWAAEQIRQYDAEELLALARRHGGRIVLRHQSDAPVERIPRAAPLVQLQGEQPSIFTFTVESSGPLTVDRIFAVEA